MDVNEDDVWVWTMGTQLPERKEARGAELTWGRRLGLERGLASWRNASRSLSVFTTLASKLAKPPWEGVWPVGGENMKVMFI